MSARCRIDDLALLAYGFLEGEACSTLREHLRGCSSCRAAFERLVREREIVAFELGLGAVDAAPVRRRLPLRAFAAAAAIVLAALGVWLVARPSPPAAPGEQAPSADRESRTSDPDRVEVVLVEVLRDPSLLTRVRELEERLRALGEEGERPRGRRERGEALDAFDWSALAAMLLESDAAARRGRLPDDPDVLRRWLIQLVAVEELAEDLEVDPTLAAVARDPDAGSRLFAATMGRRWPNAPPADLDRVREEAAVALSIATAATAAAETSAARAAAEEELRRALTVTVDAFEERHGPPVVEDEAVPSPDPVDVVLRSAALTEAAPRVIRGRRGAVEKAIVAAWTSERGHPAEDGSLLLRAARTWIVETESAFARAPSSVARTLRAELTTGSSAAISAVGTSDLRSELLRIQDTVERSLPPAPRPAAATPTYLVIER